MLSHSSWRILFFFSLFLCSSDHIISIDSFLSLLNFSSVISNLLLSTSSWGDRSTSRQECPRLPPFFLEVQQFFINKHLYICCLVRFQSSERVVFDNMVQFYSYFWRKDCWPLHVNIAINPALKWLNCLRCMFKIVQLHYLRKRNQNNNEIQVCL